MLSNAQPAVYGAYNPNEFSDQHSPAASSSSSDGLGSTLSSASASPSHSPSPTHFYSTPSAPSVQYGHQHYASAGHTYYTSPHYPYPATYGAPQQTYQYYNYPNEQQHTPFLLPHHNTSNVSSSYCDDSSYFSRNNSFSDRHEQSAPLHTPKPSLKFSIDLILSDNIGPRRQQNTDSTDQELNLRDLVTKVQKKGPRGRRQQEPQKHTVDTAANKRIRTIFSQKQLDRLEEEFVRQQYMVGSERSYLASKLDLTESQVKIWFQNRRIKWRKCGGREQQQQHAAPLRSDRSVCDDGEYESDVNEAEDDDDDVASHLSQSFSDHS